MLEFNMITFLEMDRVEARHASLGCFLFPFLCKTLLLWLLFWKKMSYVSKQDIDVKYVSFYYFHPTPSLFGFFSHFLSLSLLPPFFNQNIIKPLMYSEPF